MFQYPCSLRNTFRSLSLSTVESLIFQKKGGYCFDHAQLFASVLKEKGFDFTFRMGRVGPDGPITHLVLLVSVDADTFLVDPGFGSGPMVPLPLNGTIVEDLGFHYRILLNQETGNFTLERKDGDLWKSLYEIYNAPVKKADVQVGHFITSSFPGSIFKNGLMVGIFRDDKHEMLTHKNLIVHQNGKIKVNPMLPNQIIKKLPDFKIHLDKDESSKLHRTLQLLSNQNSFFEWNFSGK
ncbi:arylamine N-acetyltransferase [Corynebacterium ulcerans]|nr:arylamine N-acetyltransferase [Corynebacterium ulcerans]